ncbi:MAG TPA: hypothetical protein PLA50_16625 [Bacteroidia bacterium]|nr:hypothetical protein [Bacteroidia bacterium]
MPESKTSYLAELRDGEKLVLVASGNVPPGTILNGRVILTVEGPGWDFAPKDPMFQDEYQKWRAELEAKGYKFTVTQW